MTVYTESEWDGEEIHSSLQSIMQAWSSREVGKL